MTSLQENSEEIAVLRASYELVNIVLLLELMVKMPRIISAGFMNVVTVKIVRKDRK